MRDIVSLNDAVKGAGLNAINIREFLACKLPPQENVLAPIIKTQSLSMLFASRGVGKTHIALGIAYAIACGGEFLRWKAPKPRKVLYLDGEMSAYTMQKRLKAIVEKSEHDIPSENFVLITPDMQAAGMPDISTSEGQDKIEPFVKEAEIIIVDNISTLARTGKENEAESWLPVQNWALDMRSRGKSVIFVHHAGKGGQQRGSSRREDVLDLVIELREPKDYDGAQGARFEVHFTKARHITGDDAKAFEAKLFDDVWSHLWLEDVEVKRVLDLHADGLSLREIEIETGISKSRVQRMIKRES